MTPEERVPPGGRSREGLHSGGARPVGAPRAGSGPEEEEAVRGARGELRPAPALGLAPEDGGDGSSGEEPVRIPIDGVLDLHTFRPCEVGELVPDYLDVCQEVGIAVVRIVHGKGTGTLRRTVHAILARLPQVDSFRLGGAGEGGWGATLVFLKPRA
jgi:hypothetical protein